jgi:threonine aldolase
MTKRSFRSDNEAGVAREILAALARANDGTAHSYNRWPRTDDVYRFVAAFDAPSEAVDELAETARRLAG